MRGRAVLMLWVLLGAAGPAAADIFFLKDGRKLEGTAVDRGDAWEITTWSGEVVRVLKADLVGMRKEEEKNKYYARAKALKADDAAGHYDLALWAKENKLAEEATAQFRLALLADPFHEGAGKALGYVQRDGRWQPPQEQGLIIGSTGAPPQPEDRDALKRTIQRIGKLDADYGADDPAAAELIAQAREEPKVFERIVRLPGKRESANVDDPAIRARAAEVLGWSGDRRAMGTLLEAALEFQEEDRVRLAAARALAKLEEPVALRKLTDVALDGKLPWVTRRLACAALRRYGDKEAVDRLLGALSFELAAGNANDSQNKLREGPKGLGSDDPLGMPTQAPSLPTRDMTILYPALSAVKEVTGTGFDAGELDYKNWKEWWLKARGSFKFKD
ncbi:MAG: hypothetical protein AMXMBFR7_22660 [Planctomycetota bacterium]